MDNEHDLIARLTTAARAIAAGAYDLGDDLDAMADRADVPPAIADLCRAFAMMAVKVEAREFALSNTVEDLEEARRRLEVLTRRLEAENRSLKESARALEIVVDHAEREREVSEIAGSDYFQGLLEGVRKLNRKGPDGDRGGGGA